MKLKIFKNVSVGLTILTLSSSAYAEPASPELKAAMQLCQKYRMPKTPPTRVPVDGRLVDKPVKQFSDGLEQCEAIFRAWSSTDEGTTESLSIKQHDDDAKAISNFVPTIKEMQ